MSYIYMYGMVLSTRSFLLKDKYPEADGYAEIKEYGFNVGGETGAASLILSSLGCSVMMAGSNTGINNDKLIRDYYSTRNVDMRYLKFNEKFDGVIDNVIIDKDTRTCFGQFQSLYSSSFKWYEKPDEEGIKNCSVVGADPYFGDEFVKLCNKYNKKYATIDCMYDSVISKNCALAAISHQHLHDCYPDKSIDELYKLYTDNSDGLFIFTMGEKELYYGRKGQKMKTFKPFKVDVVSTLGAGDSFKAGTVYALNAGMNDDETVEFACAVAGCACANYPICKNPPTLEKVQKIISSRK